MFKMIKLVINMCFHFTFDLQGYLHIVADNSMLFFESTTSKLTSCSTFFALMSDKISKFPNLVL
jgi:hypothetical protein